MLFFISFAENLVDFLLHQLYQCLSVGEMDGVMKVGRDIGDQERVVILGLVVVFQSVVNISVGFAKISEKEE